MISWEDFTKVDMRIGTVVAAQVFKEARKPAYVLQVDFGERFGIRKSSAQITDYYQPEEIIGRQVMAVVNFPPKQIGPMKSECLVMGVYGEEDKVVLLSPERQVPNGSKIG